MKDFNWETLERDFFLQNNKFWKLDNMKTALSFLGDPHKKIENKVIHVAGTNGKGSTSNFIKTILESAGYRVGLYTSPHLVEYNERIYFNKRHITDEEIEKCKQEIVKKCANVKQISFFEITTLIAIMMFSNYFNSDEFEQLDYCIFEVGLGGRLDATNVFQQPLVSVITSISLDHTKILGNTLSEIAYEKGGIIKEQVPVFTSNTNIEVVNVLKDISNSKNAPFFCLNKNFKLDTTLQPSLYGDHQFYNATLAKEVCKYLGIDIKYIKQGIQNTQWPGRLQSVSINCIDKQRLNIDAIYLDGAHNEDGVKKLCDFIKSVKCDNVNIIGVMACLKRKNYNSFFDVITPNLFQQILFFDLSQINDDFVLADELINIASNVNINCDKIKDFKDLSFYIPNNGKKNIVFIFGSLYFVGFVLEKYTKI